MGRVTARRRLLVVVAFAVLHVALTVLEGSLQVDEGPAVALTAALLVVLLLSLGPVGIVPAVLVRCGLVLLQGGDETALAAAFVATVAWLPAMAWIDRASAQRPAARTDAVVVEFVALAAVLSPLASTWAQQVVLGETWVPADALAPALGVLLLAPGLRILVVGKLPALDATGIGWLVTGSVTFVAVVTMLAVLVDPTVLGGLPVLLLVLVAGAARLGFTRLTLLTAIGTLLTFVVVGVAGSGVDRLLLGDRLGAFAVLVVGLFAAVDTDRREEAADELDVLFRRGASPAGVVALPALQVVRPNPLLAELLHRRGAGDARRSFVELLADGPEGIGVLDPLVAGEADEVEGDVWFRDVTGAWRFGRLSASRMQRQRPLPDLALVQVVDLSEVHERTVALERANTALNRLSGRIAHDLRQPLAAIVGYASTIEEHHDRLPADLLRDMTSRLAAAANRAADRLESLADSARHAGDGPQPVDLAATLDRVAETLALDVDGSLATVQRRLDVTTVVANEGAVGTILLNLVGNALKYTRPNQAPTIRVASRALDDGWLLTVEDDGLGVPVGELERVFDRGARLDAVDVPGSGTGLTDSRDLAEAGGGWLEAVPSSEGARFELWLPNPDPVVRDEAAITPLRVLHVGEDVGQRRRLRTMVDLDERVRHVGEVAVPRDVLAAVRYARPDVVLVPAELGGEDLRPIVADVRAEDPQLAVVHVEGRDASKLLDELSRLARDARAAGRLEPHESGGGPDDGSPPAPAAGSQDEHVASEPGVR